MIETFVALLFAHAIADFALQTGWMVMRKKEPPVLLAHIAIVTLTAWIALGFPLHPALAVLALLHLVTDALKLWVLGDKLGGFLADQFLHLLALIGITLWVPELYALGVWVGTPPPWLPADAFATVPAVMLYTAGAILATTAGGYAIGKLLTPFLEQEPKLTEDSLKDAGRLIGLLERGVAYLLVVVGQPAGVGFLIAAKSVLRFTTTREDRLISEYVIIGTIASVGWALAVGYSVYLIVPLIP